MKAFVRCIHTSDIDLARYSAFSRNDNYRYKSVSKYTCEYIDKPRTIVSGLNWTQQCMFGRFANFFIALQYFCECEMTKRKFCQNIMSHSVSIAESADDKF